MREMFPGYFAPTRTELERLWQTAVFSFDANVLLKLIFIIKFIIIICIRFNGYQRRKCVSYYNKISLTFIGLSCFNFYINGIFIIL